MSELLPLAVKRAIRSLRRRTNKGQLYPFSGSGAAVFACSPSPHLSPSKLPVLPEKRDMIGRQFSQLCRNRQAFSFRVVKMRTTGNCYAIYQQASPL